MTEYTPDLAGILALAIQVLLPLLVGLVTKASTAPQVKAVILLALTSVNQFLISWLDSVNTNDVGDPFNWKLVIWNIALGFALSVVSHFGLWRAPNSNGVSVTDKVQATGVKDSYPDAA